MPRYFFDTEDGGRETDEEGVELSGEEAAIREAICYAGALLKDQPSLLTDRNLLDVSVRPDQGGAIARIQIVLSRS